MSASISTEEICKRVANVYGFDISEFKLAFDGSDSISQLFRAANFAAKLITTDDLPSDEEVQKEIDDVS